ncbi:MAG: hypothetical protein H7A25_02350 [Leptospiraceae bacterium]|nr:hypothetical protein [Leptospiraceae bacterium]MCP5498718.1 hypothetical protein [Leptospiraceae bacterium]
MQYTVWRVSPSGEAFQLTTVGASSVKERALEKAKLYNEKLRSSDPESEDIFVVRDESGKEFRPANALNSART